MRLHMPVCDGANADLLTTECHVPAGNQVSTVGAQPVTCLKGNITVNTPHRAAFLRDVCCGVRDFQTLAAHAESHTSGAHQPGFFLLFQVCFTVAFCQRTDTQVISGSQGDTVIPGHTAARDVQIMSGADTDRIPVQFTACHGPAVTDIMRGCGGFR
ncbi:hypothetical protein BvCmsSIP044_04418 [Escherichia coli]|nr:hypothetical protein BvCmsNSP072_03642 [Escherichia coli]GDV36286.1 hypothetical protein BvCmsSIP044_04418 [Escherichia coli]